jgi:hypothetical protein
MLTYPCRSKRTVTLLHGPPQALHLRLHLTLDCKDGPPGPQAATAARHRRLQAGATARQCSPRLRLPPMVHPPSPSGAGGGCRPQALTSPRQDLVAMDPLGLRLDRITMTRRRITSAVTLTVLGRLQLGRQAGTRTPATVGPQHQWQRRRMTGFHHLASCTWSGTRGPLGTCSHLLPPPGPGRGHGQTSRA